MTATTHASVHTAITGRGIEQTRRAATVVARSSGSARLVCHRDSTRTVRPWRHVVDVADPADARLDDFRDLNSVDRRPDLPSGKGLVIGEGVLVVSACWRRGSPRSR